MRSEFFWVFPLQVVVNFTDVSGQHICPIYFAAEAGNHETGVDIGFKPDIERII